MRSGLYYPNRFARTLLAAVEEVSGSHGLEMTLMMASLTQFTRELPPSDLERAVDFAQIAALNLALDELYGEKGGRGMALRAGRAWLVKGINHTGALTGVHDPAFRRVSPDERVRVTIKALTRMFSHFSDQSTFFELTRTHFRVNVTECALCWGRQAERPICHPMIGLLQETARWASNGREVTVRETACRACGADACTFTIHRLAD
jgi:predicted hydrocarbon binding protein